MTDEKIRKVYNVELFGRTTGALGITYKIHDRIVSDNIKEAKKIIGEKYECLSHLKINETNIGWRDIPKFLYSDEDFGLL